MKKNFSLKKVIAAAAAAIAVAVFGTAALANDGLGDEIGYFPEGPVYTVQSETGYIEMRTDDVYTPNNEIGAIWNDDIVVVLDRSGFDFWYAYSPSLGYYGFVSPDHLYYIENEYADDDQDAYIDYDFTDDDYSVYVATGYLALRNAPEYDYANEIGCLYTGDVVTLTGTGYGQYWLVYSPQYGQYGYVNSNYLF